MSDRPSSRSPFKTADYPFTNARPYIFLNEIAPANPTIAPLPSGIARAWVQPVIAQDWRSHWLWAGAFP